jgi:hypothetical protein
VYGNDMHDSAEEQQVNERDMNHVPQGKQAFPAGKLGRPDNGIEIPVNLLLGQLVADDEF